MRVLIVNEHRALVGGVETYLEAVVPALNSTHETLFMHEAQPAPSDRLIEFPTCTKLATSAEVKNVLERFRPDLIFAQSVNSLELQRKLLARHATVFFAHSYVGLCISGTKTWKRAPAHPCGQLFSWRCLWHYPTKSCGGRSPFTMVREFRKQSRQLEILKRADALVTHAGPMFEEYLRQGISKEHLFALPHFVPAPVNLESGPKDARAVRLAFVGRFHFLKGGELLIKALPMVARELTRPVVLSMAGAGSEEAHWRKLANEISSPAVTVEFLGWLDRERKDALLGASDLIVVPSIWPEPFGQVGLEAAQLGTPAVAFNVGGISRWLRAGVSGHFADAAPPSAEGLADAIVTSLRDPAHYAELRKGAREIAGEFSLENHVTALNEVFEFALKERRK